MVDFSEIQLLEENDSIIAKINDGKTLRFYFADRKNAKEQIHVFLDYSDSVAPQNSDSSSRKKICRIRVQGEIDSTTAEKIDVLADSFLQENHAGKRNLFINNNGRIVPINEYRSEFVDRHSQKYPAAPFAKPMNGGGDPELVKEIGEYLGKFFCSPDNGIYLKLLSEFSVDDLMPRRFAFFHKKALTEYKILKKIVDKNPEILELCDKLNISVAEDFDIKTFLTLVHNKKSITLSSGESKIELPLTNVDGNGWSFKFGKALQKVSFEDAASMLKQLDVISDFITYTSITLADHIVTVSDACKELREKRAEEKKIKELMDAKEADFAPEDGLAFSIVRPETPEEKTDKKETKEKTKPIAKSKKALRSATTLPSEFIDGHLSYKKVDTFTKLLTSKKKDIVEILKRPLFPHKITYTPSTGIVPENARDLASMIEPELPAEQRAKLLKLPVSIPVFSEEQGGFIICKRLDGADFFDEGLYPNSKVFSFKVENDDLSDGKYANTEEMVEALKQKYGVGEIIDNIDEILNTEAKPQDESIYLMDEKKGALQVSVWAKSKLGYKQDQVERNGDEVKRELERNPNTDSEGFSTYGIPLKVKDLKNTIYDITEKRKEAHKRLAEQVEILIQYGFAESQEVMASFDLAESIPEFISKKAMAELSAKIEGNEINRLHKIEFLKLWYAEYKRLLSQIKINDQKLSEIEYIVTEYLDAPPEDKEAIKALAGEMPSGEKLEKMLDACK